MLVHKSDWAHSVVAGWIVSSVVYLVGGVDHLFIACSIFVILDYFTGVMAAWYQKSFPVGWGGGGFQEVAYIRIRHRCPSA